MEFGKGIPGPCGNRSTLVTTNTLFPFTFQKTQRVKYFEAPARARGQRRASRNHKATVFPWYQAGPQTFRLSVRKLFWFRCAEPGSRPVLSRIAPPPPRPVQAFASKTNTREASRKQMLTGGQGGL